MLSVNTGVTNTRIVGIDPGIARMGFGVIDSNGSQSQPVAFGCIQTLPDLSVEQRLLQIYEQILEVIQTHQPDVLAVEQLFFNRNTTTAFTVGQARGVALLAGAICHLKCVEYTPMQIKLAVVGYGKAEKAQVQEMVRVLLHLRDRPKPDDTADALAVALTHAHVAPLHLAIQRSQRGIEPARRESK